FFVRRFSGGTLSGGWDPVRVVGPCQGGGTLSGWWDPVRVRASKDFFDNVIDSLTNRIFVSLKI
ncbi:MAG: hypothetical protein AB9842_00005, partial [Bacteroidales bacterium]